MYGCPQVSGVRVHLLSVQSDFCLYQLGSEFQDLCKFGMSLWREMPKQVMHLECNGPYS